MTLVERREAMPISSLILSATVTMSWQLPTPPSPPFVTT